MHRPSFRARGPRHARRESLTTEEVGRHGVDLLHRWVTRMRD
ncbi:hypothetical protein QEG98_39840 [Myxococcus sp. MxC21-1]|nr:hypothetical protein [Myxococcus sp. MxC21-1]WNZ61923.1 hypothetical protein QEG98_39840 [Myxococcus sp. MxC21-1]